MIISLAVNATFRKLLSAVVLKCSSKSTFKDLSILHLYILGSFSKQKRKDVIKLSTHSSDICSKRLFEGALRAQVVSSFYAFFNLPKFSNFAHCGVGGEGWGIKEKRGGGKPK